jgi:hypothetical protein
MAQPVGLHRMSASCLLATLTLVVCAGSGRADLLFSGSSSSSGSSGSLSASAQFDLMGNTLTVTLTNTSSADVLVPTDVLTGVFFNTTHKLTPVSANLHGSTVYYGSLTNVGDGWGYGSGVNAQGKNSAISATGAVNGLGMSNFSSQTHALQGLDYGILSAGDNPNTGNTGVTGHGPLIKNSVQFVLTAAAGFSLSELGNTVVFQYGTALSETHFSSGGTPLVIPVPAPPSAAMLGIGCCMLGLVGWFRWRPSLAKA